MASIRDVAKKANVAACTVSRVLNSTGKVTPETKLRIEAAMQELHYIPNELARSMFRKKTGIIAMLVPSIKHPYFSSLSNYIERELYMRGYKLMLCSTGDTLEREADYLEMFKTNLVDGIIMGVSNLSDNHYADFQKPIVMLDYRVNEVIPTVSSNHALGGKLAAQKFIECGSQLVLHLRGNSPKPVLSRQCHTQLQEELRKAGVASIEKSIEWDAFDFEGYLQMAKDILTQNPRIDAFMGADMSAIAFLQVARELRREVPHQFAVIAYDGTYAVNLCSEKVTTIRQSLRKIAERTVFVMSEMLENRLLETPHEIIEVELVQGDTTV